MGTNRPLRLAFLLPTFPELSNTFIIEQITGLLDRGHLVDLFAIERKSFGGLAPGLRHFELERRMQHLEVARGRLRRLGLAVRILTGPGGLHPAHLDALNPRQYGRQAWNLVQLHTAASFVRAGPYDVLHCHFGQLGPIGERLVRFGAVEAALVTSFRGADLASHYPAHPQRFEALFRRGDLHLPVSADFGRRLLAAGVPEDRVVVHHDGIDLSRFTFAERSAPDGVARLLFVGRLTEKKGVAYALEALATLIRSGRRAELTIIGDGPLGPSLRARSHELGLDGHAQFVGPRPLDDVAAAMQAAHVLAAPSVTAANGDQEGIPTVIKEAMATGMPVASTHHSGIPELVQHGVTGYLAPERDAGTLAEHLAEHLDHPERWPEMGRAGRRKVEAAFDTDRLNDALVERYREAVAGHAGRMARHTTAGSTKGHATWQATDSRAPSDS